MPRHSFIRMTKLTDVRGRVDYISNPKRQEHLYASYSTVESVFWKNLSEQAQHDFWKSNQKSGKCIEGRELIIALPESLQRKDPESLLQLFVATFRKKYGVQCTAALHHNKAMTNYHIHLVFADRDLLEEADVKRASRNMFFNEDGRHVRTKKEILDEVGEIRPGCKIIPKGQVYEMKCFTGRKEIFKERHFIDDVKMMYTDLINQLVDREEDRLQVFDPSGPYLPTKKIGKNNPKEDEIRSDNQLRKKWNRTVDQVLIAGGEQDEVIEFKHTEVLDKVAASVKENGRQPGMFATIIREAIAVLVEFLELLMRSEETERDVSTEVTTLDMENMKAAGKGLRPDSRREELRYSEMQSVHQMLNGCHRKLFALQNQKKVLQMELDNTSKLIFYIKTRKELQQRIDGLQCQIDKCHDSLETIPKMYGFRNVSEAEAAYKTAKKALEDVRRRQDEWDGKLIEIDSRITEQPRRSIRERLAEKQTEVKKSENKRHRKRGMEL